MPVTQCPLAFVKAADGSGSYLSSFIRFDACQGVTFPGHQDGDTRGTRRQGRPRLSLDVLMTIGLFHCFSPSCPFINNLLLSVPCNYISCALSMNMFLFFSSCSSSSFFETNTSRNVWLLLYESSQALLGSTTRSRAAFRFLFRANGSSTRPNAYRVSTCGKAIHAICDNTFASSDSYS